MKQKMVPTLITNWKVWPILQLINFTLVPPPLQVFYVNFMQLWWNVYLSFMKNSAPIAEASNQDIDCSIIKLEAGENPHKLKSSVQAFELEADSQDELIQQQMVYSRMAKTLELQSI